MANHYQILGVPNFSSAKEIQKAFRRLALQYHPDKHDGSAFHEEKFKKINASYQFLSDPYKKAIYDQRLLYGYQPKQTNIHQSARPPRKQASTEYKKTYTYQAKTEVEYKHSFSQKVFQVASIGLLLLFCVLSYCVNIWHEKEDPVFHLENEYKGLFSRLERSFQDNDYQLVDQQIDSIQYFNASSLDKDGVVNHLLISIERYGQELFESEDYEKSKIFHDLNSSLCKKYQAQESVVCKIRRIKTHLQLGVDATELIDDLMKQHIRTASNGFWFAEVLLEFHQYEKAEAVLSQTIDNTLIAVQRKYGPSYWAILEDGIMDEQLLYGMIQMVCLNRNISKRDESVVEDHLTTLLRDERTKAFYQGLKKMGFDKKTVLESGFLDTNQVQMEVLNLAGFYK